ncbi:MAG: ATP-binding protein, partial [Dehalococcoidia bacterium]
RPLLLVLEDLQWVDRGTVELVRYLAGPIQNRAVLLVCTHRPDEAPPGSPLADLTNDLLRERLGQRLDLHPLDQRATGELIRAFFQLDRPVSGEFAAAVHGCASGNPFFIEEAIKSLIERGDVFVEDGQVQRRDLQDLVLPAAARELVTARLSHLTPESRRVLEPLTVAGRPCAIAVLAHVAGLSPADAATAAGEAYRRGFLVSAPGGYRFRHDLVRRALLEQLLPEEQGALHLRLAQAIEHVYAGALEPWAEQLARHYWAAGRPVAAAGPAWAAAVRAATLHAYREALPYLRMCDAAGSAGPHREAVLELLGDAHARTGAPSEAVTAYRSLLAEAKAGNRPGCAGRALRKLAELAHDQGDPHRALALCRRAVAVLGEAGDQRELAAAYTGVARYESATGDWRAAVATAERAVAAAEASGEVQAFCPAANWLAFHLAYTGQIDRAEGYALRSVERAAAAADLPALQQASQTLGTISGDIRADYTRARHAYLRSLRIARRCDDLPSEVKALHNLGAWVSKPLGRWRRAELLLARARARAVDAGLHRHAVYALLHLVELAWLRGDLCLLEEQLQTLEAEVIQYGDLMTRCRLAAKVQAPWLIHRGCPAAARAELRARWEEAERAGFVGGLVVLGPPLAETLLELGDPDGAAAVLNRVQTLWPGVGDRAEIIEGRRVLASLFAAQGHATQALHVLHQTEAEACALRRPFDVARLHRQQAVL